jgi:hypothetical protein
MAATTREPAVFGNRLPTIPDPPKRGAVRSLQRALLSRTLEPGEIGLSVEAADAIAFAVADPAETRTMELRRPSYSRVPGGTFTVIRDRVLVNRVVTYPVNPRVLESARFPIAEGRQALDRLFWPEHDLTAVPDGHCALLLRGGRRARVASVLEEHANRLKEQNKLESVPEIGVLRPIVLMAMTVTADDESADPRTVLTSVEGSSRTAASHRAQGLRPADPLYGATADPSAAQQIARDLSEVRLLPAAEVSPRDQQRARTLLIPAEIVIGFTPDGSSEGLLSAVDQLLGLTHIDPPAAWSAQAAESTVGEKVLSTLEDRSLLRAGEHAWLAGMATTEQAHDAGIDTSKARRAARLLWLASRAPASDVGQAVGDGIKRASQTRSARRESRANVAAALALRALDTAATTDHGGIRAAMPRAMRAPLFYETGKGHGGYWKLTGRSPDELRDAALMELEEGDPGPAALELAALAVWPLVIDAGLARGRARRPPKGGDPRDPEQIIGGLTHATTGVRVLHRIVSDALNGIHPRTIDLSTFAPQPTSDGEWTSATNRWLRNVVLPTDDTRADDENDDRDSPPLTPGYRLETKLSQLDGQVDGVGGVLDEAEAIVGDDGAPTIQREGIDDDRADSLLLKLNAAMFRITNHKTSYNATYGSLAEPDDEDDHDA